MNGARDHADRGAVGTAVLAAVAVIASFVAGKAARDAVLLSNFDVTLLPLFVGIAAASSLPLVLIVGRLTSRFGPARLMPLLNAASALLLIGEWFVLARWPRVGAVATFLHLSAFGAVLVSGFWSVVNERFDARFAKRHIGKIGVGATIGGILGGIAAERVAVYLVPGAILLVLAGMQLACAVAQRVLASPHTRSASSEPVNETAPWTALKVIAGSALLRNLTLVVVLGAVAAAALDYVFKAGVVAATAGEGPLRFFAIYYTVTNIATAVAQIVLARTVLARVGVARAIAILPATVTVFGIGALAVPGLASGVIARGMEMVVRSSLYRAAYELLYAPLAENHKRSTKVVLDVGAERLGDLLGAVVVGLVLYVAVPTLLLVAAIAAGAAALYVAMRLPHGYTAALEASLMTRGHEPQLEPSLSGSWSGTAPIMAEAGDLTALSLLDLRAAPARLSASHVPHVPARKVSLARDDLADRVEALRSGDQERVTRALATAVPVELASHVVPLIGWNEVAEQATATLRAIAPRCTGLLVDSLLDAGQEFAVCRRLPAILVVGEPALAAWGLWRGIRHPRFEVRYRCAKALSRLRVDGRELEITEAAVFAAIKRELSVGGSIWKNHQLLDGPSEPSSSDEALFDRLLTRGSSRGLEHVFTLLGLVLPTHAVQIALQGIHTDDRGLRGTALEYLESVLPADVRTLLWEHVEPDHAPQPSRPRDEILRALTMSHASIIANLRARNEG